jgi:hypothetical protein
MSRDEVVRCQKVLQLIKEPVWMVADKSLEVFNVVKVQVPWSSSDAIVVPHNVASGSP